MAPESESESHGGAEHRHARNQQPETSAFHLRKRGRRLRDLDENDLEQIPLGPEGTLLKHGATYANLADDEATANILTGSQDARAPKDRGPYEIWNQPIGEPKPGQE